MTQIFAKVRSVIGSVKHLKGVVGRCGLEVEDFPDPISVEIVEKDGAYYLLRLDREGRCLADTWHCTLIEAKEQAKFEFGIEIDDWSDQPQIGATKGGGGN